METIIIDITYITRFIFAYVIIPFILGVGVTTIMRLYFTKYDDRGEVLTNTIFENLITFVFVLFIMLIYIIIIKTF